MKHVAHLVLITLVAGVFFLLMVFGEKDMVLYAVVVPPADVTLEEWLDSFKRLGTAGIAISLTAGLGWYVLGQWGFRNDVLRVTNRRPLWGLFFLLPLLGVILGIVLTQQAQEGGALAYLFYFINGVASYYLETALFSPSAFKYTPIGASKLRRWNLTFSTQTDSSQGE